MTQAILDLLGLCDDMFSTMSKNDTTWKIGHAVAVTINRTGSIMQIIIRLDAPRNLRLGGLMGKWPKNSCPLWIQIQGMNILKIVGIRSIREKFKECDLRKIC